MSAISDWWGGVWKDMKEGWAGLGTYGGIPIGQHKFPVALLQDLAIATSDGSGWNDKANAINSWSDFFHQQQGYTASYANLGAPVFKAAPVEWAGNKLTALQKNAVNRPISTAATALGPSMFGITGAAYIPDEVYQNAKDPLSVDTWRQAWNDSEKVTAGQAISYQAGLATGQIPVDDPSYNPRNSKEHYYNDGFYIATSGGIDFILSLVDPIKGIGKLAGLGRLTLLDRALKPAQVAKGGLEVQTFGKGAEYGQDFDAAGGQLTGRTESLYNAARTLDESTFQKSFFNNFAQGPIVSSALSAAAKNGDRATFADILLAARGNQPAYERLVLSPGGAQVGEAMGQTRNVYNVATVTARRADDPFSRQVADAQTAAHAEAWIDQFRSIDNTGDVPMGWADIKGSMSGMGTPRRTLGQMFATGVQSAAAAGYLPKTVARWRTPSVLDSSRGYAPHLEVNLSASVNQFRANLERAGAHLDDATRNRYVAAYAAALTPNERSQIAAMADNFVLSKIASNFGVPRADIDKIVQETSLRRQTMRQILNASERYMPQEFAKAAAKLARAGAMNESAKLTALAKRYQEMVEAGELPANVQFLSDDMGRLVIVPGKVYPASPILTSQGADYLPMTDYRKADRLMRSIVAPKITVQKYLDDQYRIGKGEEPIHNVPKSDYLKARARGAAGLAAGTTADFYKAVNSLWSVAAVLRPGQTIRTLADDGMRAMTLVGMIPTLTSGSKGLLRLPYNLTRRASTWVQEREAAKALRAASTGNPTVEVGDIGPVFDAALARRTSHSSGFYLQSEPWSDLTPREMGPVTMYDSLEAAMVNGQISFDTYLDHVSWAARQGRIPYELGALVEEYELGLIKPQTYANEVAAWALASVGRDSFANPRWQQDVLDAVNAKRIKPLEGVERMGWNNPTGLRDDIADAVNELGYDDVRGILVQPLTDEAIHDPSRRVGLDYELGNSVTLHTNPATGEFDDVDGMYDFIMGNVGHFVSGAELHIKQLPDTRVRLSVARRKDIPTPTHERMSARQKQELAKGLRTAGATGVTLRMGDRSVEIPGSFAGSDGDFARSATSSRPNDMPWQVLLSMRAGDRVIATSNRVAAKDLLPEAGRDYDVAWERSVNAQLASDMVARQFLEGRSLGQVLDWVESTPAGQRWLNDRGQRTLHYDEQVQAIQGLVEHLVPEAGGQELRNKVLSQQATIADLEAAVPDASMRPAVNGAVTETNLGTHPAMRWVAKRLDNWFKWTQDKPADVLVRFPFFNQMYKSHITPMVKTYLAQLPKDALVDRAEIDRMARMARQQALFDTRQYLYDTTFRTDAAAALSAVMPFSQAVADSVFKWLKIARQKPFETASNFATLYNAPARAGLVYDQDGNHLTLTADGEEVWRAPVTGEIVTGGNHERFVAFAAPSTVRNHLLGKGAIQPNVFSQASMTNAIFDPSVNVGPIIALPVNRFALKDPEIAENAFVKKFVLPFGPTSDEASMALPGLLRSAREWYKDDASKADSRAMTVYQQMLTDYSTGKRKTIPTIEDAQKQASYEQMLRFFASAVQPASYQMVNPYKPFTDYYSNLLRKHDYNEDAAMTEFRNNGMYDEFLYQTARVTKSNIAIPATVKGYQEYQRKKDAILKYPELSGLITGRDGSGAFSKAVYEWEKNQKYDETGKTIREVMGISESIDDVKKRTGWNDYQKFMAVVQSDLESRGLRSIRDHGAEDILSAYQTWINAKVYDYGPNGEIQLSPWYQDFKNTDETYMQTRLTQMRALIAENPEWVRSRPEFQGLANYFAARDKVKTAMDFYGYATLGSKKAAWLSDYWNSQVFGLKNNNLAFAQLYDRWLTRDNLGADGLSASTIIAMLEGVSGVDAGYASNMATGVPAGVG